MKFYWKAVGLEVPPVVHPEMGLAQVNRSDPALVQSAPSMPGLHLVMSTSLYFLTPSLGSGITTASALLPAKPVKLGTLRGDTNNSRGPGDFHMLP